MDRIDKLIEAYEGRLTLLRQIRSLMASDPDLAAELLETSKIYSVRTRPRAGTQLGRLVDYLKDGKWRTLPEIAEAVGAKGSSLAPHLSRQVALFEARRYRKNPRMKQWRLRHQHTEDTMTS
jgi:hypothetical protein